MITETNHVDTKRKRPTLKEVALQAQVSQAAASTVLSGRMNGIRVNPSTEARIREAADTVGYHWRRTQVTKSASVPEEAVRNLSPAGRALVRPLLSPGIIARYSPTKEGASNDPWDDEVPAAFEKAIGEVCTATSRYYNRWRFGEPNIPMDIAVRSLIGEGANALVVVDFDDLDAVSAYIPVLEACGAPFVVVSSGSLHLPIANVCYDSRTAGYQAALHLIRKGHRKITFFSPQSADWVDQRIDGAKAALRQENIPLESLVIYPEHRQFVIPNEAWGPLIERAYEGALQAFKQGVIGSAVIAANDQIALGVARAAADVGRQLWRDIALIGFDDVPAARFQGISTLRAPRAEMGVEAAQILLRQWEGKRTQDLACLRSTIMVRASTSEWAGR